MKKVTDPGHGGSDRSNRGPTGYVEADGNLQRALFLKEYCKDMVLTRDRDMTLSLTARGQMARGADFFLSQHSDAVVGDPTVGGVTVFGSVDLPQDRAFGEALGKATAATMGINFRGYKIRESKNYPGEDYYTVIDTAQDAGCPHVFLIECGFHTNPKEEAILKNASIMRNVAKAQAKVIDEYLGIKGVDDVLNLGDKGMAVSDLQTKLNKLGYKLAVDGSFGPATEAAVRDFQKKYGLEVDGIVGPITEAKITQLLAPTPAINYKAKYDSLMSDYNKVTAENILIKNKINQIKTIIG